MSVYSFNKNPTSNSFYQDSPHHCTKRKEQLFLIYCIFLMYNLSVCQGVGGIQSIPLKRVCMSFLPIQTSPKQPCPSLRSRRRDSRGISQASLASPWVWGLATGHTSVRAWHSPSECSERGRGRESEEKWEWKGKWRAAGLLEKGQLPQLLCVVSTYCGNGRLAAVGWWTGCGRWCRNLHYPASWSCNV